MLLIGTAWTVAVVWWPQLHLQDDPDALGWQSQVTIGLASIVAGLIALLLTVGLAAIQLRASLSWRVMRGIFDVPARVGLLTTVSIGVAAPLWVAMSPSARWSRWAFAAFGWSLILVAVMVWIGMERAAPEWLVNRAIRRAVRAACRARRTNGSDLVDRTDIVIELGSHAALGPAQRRRALAAAAFLLASRAHSNEHQATTAAAIGRIAQISTNSSADPSGTLDTVTVLTTLGNTLTHNATAHSAIRAALTGIAQRARAGGHHAVGNEALDGLAEVTIARLTELLPTYESMQSARPGSRQLRPAEVVEKITSAAAKDLLQDTDVDDIVSAAHKADDQAERSKRGDPHELLETTTADLVGMLASPRPDASRWPGGWQGPSALANDVRRIGDLVKTLYQDGRYTATDTVEKALEGVAASLQFESGSRISRPPDRTGWRDASDLEDTDPVKTVGEVLGALMVAAFEAGFDRRALLTGRRLLATITSTATSGDIQAAVALEASFRRAILQLTRHQPDQTSAHRVRESRLLAGLIAELDPLLAACQADDRFNDVADDAVVSLVWSTNGNPVPLASAAWKARLRAAGWISSGFQRRRGGEQSIRTRPLPDQLVAEAKDELRTALIHGPKDPTYAAALISSLWAHAIASLRQDGDPAPARHLHELLSRWRKELVITLEEVDESRLEEDGAPHPPRLSRKLDELMAAASRWLASTRRKATYPRPEGTFAMRVRDALDSPRFVDWSYAGLRGPETLVRVDTQDGSRRLLRDLESRARGEFEWGYGGTGPTTLAEIISLDALDDLVWCQACLGGSACAGELIRCAECKGTGFTAQLCDFQLAVAERVESLPRSNDGWLWTRREILDHALDTLARSKVSR
ncbi:hypothetical protein ACIBG5_10710 [Kribbella sp. NPDC050241]|uniref:hypothetical protein n=1 Tax=Kribbella sp. NPDC050241 TaxID=3364115 RepID=UPI0037B1418C